MTRFFCQELLYDYVTGQLTPERKAEVDAYLKSDDVCREDLMRIKKAMVYCQNLSTIKTPNEWADRWRNLPPALAKRISNWELKIVSKLWSALPYTVSVVVLILGMVIFKPWRTLMNREVVVWSAKEDGIAATAAATVAATASPTATVAATTPTPVAEKKPEPAKPEPVKVAEVKPPPETPAAKEELLKSEEMGPPEKLEDIATTTIFGPPRETAAATVPIAVAKQEEKTPTPDEEDDKPAALREAAKGELYRWFLETGDFENVTNAIKDKIIALKGEKARKVELGWHSKEDESYFHFSLPESNREELIKYLKTFGPVRLLKEKHPVVMPAGKIRIILILKEAAERDEPDHEDEPQPKPSAAPPASAAPEQQPEAQTPEVP